MDCSLPGSSDHGILQARTLEWAVVPFSRGSSQSSDQTQVSHCKQILYRLSHQGNPCALKLNSKSVSISLHDVMLAVKFTPSVTLRATPPPGVNHTPTHSSSFVTIVSCYCYFRGHTHLRGSECKASLLSHPHSCSQMEFGWQFLSCPALRMTRQIMLVTASWVCFFFFLVFSHQHWKTLIFFLM